MCNLCNPLILESSLKPHISLLEALLARGSAARESARGLQNVALLATGFISEECLRVFEACTIQDSLDAGVEISTWKSANRK